MARNANPLNSIPQQGTPSPRQQRSIESSHHLTPSQFATHQALANLLPSPGSSLALADYQLGLDALDTLARTHTNYPFAELPTDLQDAMLHLIAARDLTTPTLDLAHWLEDLRTAAAA
jgi:hypothetical protein